MISARAGFLVALVVAGLLGVFPNEIYAQSCEGNYDWSCNYPNQCVPGSDRIGGIGKPCTIEQDSCTTKGKCTGEGSCSTEEGAKVCEGEEEIITSEEETRAKAEAAAKAANSGSGAYMPGEPLPPGTKVGDPKAPASVFDLYPNYNPQFSGTPTSPNPSASDALNRLLQNPPVFTSPQNLQNQSLLQKTFPQYFGGTQNAQNLTPANLKQGTPSTIFTPQDGVVTSDPNLNPSQTFTSQLLDPAKTKGLWQQIVDTRTALDRALTQPLRELYQNGVDMVAELRKVDFNPPLQTALENVESIVPEQAASFDERLKQLADVPALPQDLSSYLPEIERQRALIYQEARALEMQARGFEPMQKSLEDLGQQLQSVAAKATPCPSGMCLSTEDFAEYESLKSRYDDVRSAYENLATKYDADASKFDSSITEYNKLASEAKQAFAVNEIARKLEPQLAIQESERFLADARGCTGAAGCASTGLDAYKTVQVLNNLNKDLLSMTRPLPACNDPSCAAALVNQAQNNLPAVQENLKYREQVLADKSYVDMSKYAGADVFRQAEAQAKVDAIQRNIEQATGLHKLLLKHPDSGSIIDTFNAPDSPAKTLFEDAVAQWITADAKISEFNSFLTRNPEEVGSRGTYGEGFAPTIQDALQTSLSQRDYLGSRIGDLANNITKGTALSPEGQQLVNDLKAGPSWWEKMARSAMEFGEPIGTKEFWAQGPISNDPGLVPRLLAGWAGDAARRVAHISGNPFLMDATRNYLSSPEIRARNYAGDVSLTVLDVALTAPVLKAPLRATTQFASRSTQNIISRIAKSSIPETTIAPAAAPPIARIPRIGEGITPSSVTPTEALAQVAERSASRPSTATPPPAQTAPVIAQGAQEIAAVRQAGLDAARAVAPPIAERTLGTRILDAFSPSRVPIRDLSNAQRSLGSQITETQAKIARNNELRNNGVLTAEAHQRIAGELGGELAQIESRLATIRQAADTYVPPLQTTARAPSTLTAAPDAAPVAPAQARAPPIGIGDRIRSAFGRPTSGERQLAQANKNLGKYDAYDQAYAAQRFQSEFSAMQQEARAAGGETLAQKMATTETFTPAEQAIVEPIAARRGYTPEGVQETFTRHRSVNSEAVRDVTESVVKMNAELDRRGAIVADMEALSAESTVNRLAQIQKTLEADIARGAFSDIDAAVISRLYTERTARVAFENGNAYRAAQIEGLSEVSRGNNAGISTGGGKSDLLVGDVGVQRLRFGDNARVEISTPDVTESAKYLSERVGSGKFTRADFFRMNGMEPLDLSAQYLRGAEGIQAIKSAPQNSVFVVDKTSRGFLSLNADAELGTVLNSRNLVRIDEVQEFASSRTSAILARDTRALSTTDGVAQRALALADAIGLKKLGAVNETASTPRLANLGRSEIKAADWNTAVSDFRHSRGSFADNGPAYAKEIGGERIVLNDDAIAALERQGFNLAPGSTDSGALLQMLRRLEEAPQKAGTYGFANVDGTRRIVPFSAEGAPQLTQVSQDTAGQIAIALRHGYEPTSIVRVSRTSAETSLSELYGPNLRNGGRAVGLSGTPEGTRALTQAKIGTRTSNISTSRLSLGKYNEIFTSDSRMLSNLPGSLRDANALVYSSEPSVFRAIEARALGGEFGAKKVIAYGPDGLRVNGEAVAGKLTDHINVGTDTGNLFIVNEGGAVGRNYQGAFHLYAMDIPPSDLLTQLTGRVGRPVSGGNGVWESKRFLLADQTVIGDKIRAAAQAQSRGEYARALADLDSSGRGSSLFKQATAELDGVTPGSLSLSERAELQSKIAQIEELDRSAKFVVDQGLKNRLVLDPLKNALRNDSSITAVERETVRAAYEDAIGASVGGGDLRALPTPRGGVARDVYVQNSLENSVARAESAIERISANGRPSRALSRQLEVWRSEISAAKNLKVSEVGFSDSAFAQARSIEETVRVARKLGDAIVTSEAPARGVATALAREATIDSVVRSYVQGLVSERIVPNVSSRLISALRESSSLAPLPLIVPESTLAGYVPDIVFEGESFIDNASGAEVFHLTSNSQIIVPVQGSPFIVSEASTLGVLNGLAIDEVALTTGLGVVSTEQSTSLQPRSILSRFGAQRSLNAINNALARVGIGGSSAQSKQETVPAGGAVGPSGLDASSIPSRSSLTVLQRVVAAAEPDSLLGRFALAIQPERPPIAGRSATAPRIESPLIQDTLSDPRTERGGIGRGPVFARPDDGIGGGIEQTQTTARQALADEVVAAIRPLADKVSREVTNELMTKLESDDPYIIPDVFLIGDRIVVINGDLDRAYRLYEDVLNSNLPQGIIDAAASAILAHIRAVAGEDLARVISLSIPRSDLSFADRIAFELENDEGLGVAFKNVTVATDALSGRLLSASIEEQDRFINALNGRDDAYRAVLQLLSENERLEVLASRSFRPIPEKIIQGSEFEGEIPTFGLASALDVLRRNIEVDTSLYVATVNLMLADVHLARVVGRSTVDIPQRSRLAQLFPRATAVVDRWIGNSLGAGMQRGGVLPFNPIEAVSAFGDLATLGLAGSRDVVALAINRGRTDLSDTSISDPATARSIRFDDSLGRMNIYLIALLQQFDPSTSASPADSGIERGSGLAEFTRRGGQSQFRSPNQLGTLDEVVQSPTLFGSSREILRRVDEYLNTRGVSVSEPSATDEKPAGLAQLTRGQQTGEETEATVRTAKGGITETFSDAKSEQVRVARDTVELLLEEHALFNGVIANTPERQAFLRVLRENLAQVGAEFSPDGGIVDSASTPKNKIVLVERIPGGYRMADSGELIPFPVSKVAATPEAQNITEAERSAVRAYASAQRMQVVTAEDERAQISAIQVAEIGLRNAGGSDGEGLVIATDGNIVRSNSREVVALSKGDNYIFVNSEEGRKILAIEDVPVTYVITSNAGIPIGRDPDAEELQNIFEAEVAALTSEDYEEIFPGVEVVDVNTNGDGFFRRLADSRWGKAARIGLAGLYAFGVPLNTGLPTSADATLGGAALNYADNVLEGASTFFGGTPAYGGPSQDAIAQIVDNPLTITTDEIRGTTMIQDGTADVPANIVEKVRSAIDDSSLSLVEKERIASDYLRYFDRLPPEFRTEEIVRAAAIFNPLKALIELDNMMTPKQEGSILSMLDELGGEKNNFRSETERRSLANMLIAGIFSADGAMRASALSSREDIAIRLARAETIPERYHSEILTNVFNIEQLDPDSLFKAISLLRTNHSPELVRHIGNRLQNYKDPLSEALSANGYRIYFTLLLQSYRDLLLPSAEKIVALMEEGKNVDTALVGLYLAVDEKTSTEANSVKKILLQSVDPVIIAWADFNAKRKAQLLSELSFAFDMQVADHDYLSHLDGLGINGSFERFMILNAVRAANRVNDIFARDGSSLRVNANEILALFLAEGGERELGVREPMSVQDEFSPFTAGGLDAYVEQLKDEALLPPAQKVLTSFSTEKLIQKGFDPASTALNENELGEEHETYKSLSLPDMMDAVAATIAYRKTQASELVGGDFASRPASEQFFFVALAHTGGIEILKSHIARYGGSTKLSLSSYPDGSAAYYASRKTGSYELIRQSEVLALHSVRGAEQTSVGDSTFAGRMNLGGSFAEGVEATNLETPTVIGVVGEDQALSASPSDITGVETNPTLRVRVADALGALRKNISDVLSDFRTRPTLIGALAKNMRGFTFAEQQEQIGKTQFNLVSTWFPPGLGTASGMKTNSSMYLVSIGSSIPGDWTPRMGTHVLLEDPEGKYEPIVAVVAERFRVKDRTISPLEPSPGASKSDVDFSENIARHFRIRSSGSGRINVTILDNPPDSVAHVYQRQFSSNFNFEGTGVKSFADGELLLAQARGDSEGTVVAESKSVPLPERRPSTVVVGISSASLNPEGTLPNISVTVVDPDASTVVSKTDALRSAIAAAEESGALKKAVEPGADEPETIAYLAALRAMGEALVAQKKASQVIVEYRPCADCQYGVDATRDKKPFKALFFHETSDRGEVRPGKEDVEDAYSKCSDLGSSIEYWVCVGHVTAGGDQFGAHGYWSTEGDVVKIIIAASMDKHRTNHVRGENSTSFGYERVAIEGDLLSETDQAAIEGIVRASLAIYPDLTLKSHRAHDGGKHDLEAYQQVEYLKSIPDIAEKMDPKTLAYTPSARYLAKKYGTRQVADTLTIPPLPVSRASTLGEGVAGQEQPGGRELSVQVASGDAATPQQKKALEAFAEAVDTLKISLEKARERFARIGAVQLDTSTGVRLELREPRTDVTADEKKIVRALHADLKAVRARVDDLKKVGLTPTLESEAIVKQLSDNFFEYYFLASRPSLDAQVSNDPYGDIALIARSLALHFDIRSDDFVQYAVAIHFQETGGLANMGNIGPDCVGSFQLCNDHNERKQFEKGIAEAQKIIKEQKVPPEFILRFNEEMEKARTMPDPRYNHFLNTVSALARTHAQHAAAIQRTYPNDALKQAMVGMMLQLIPTDTKKALAKSTRDETRNFRIGRASVSALNSNLLKIPEANATFADVVEAMYQHQGYNENLSQGIAVALSRTPGRDENVGDQVTARLVRGIPVNIDVVRAAAPTFPADVFLRDEVIERIARRIGGGDTITEPVLIEIVSSPTNVPPLPERRVVDTTFSPNLRPSIEEEERRADVLVVSGRTSNAIDIDIAATLVGNDLLFTKAYEQVSNTILDQFNGDRAKASEAIAQKLVALWRSGVLDVTTTQGSYDPITADSIIKAKLMEGYLRNKYKVDSGGDFTYKDFAAIIAARFDGKRLSLLDYVTDLNRETLHRTYTLITAMEEDGTIGRNWTLTSAKREAEYRPKPEGNAGTPSPTTPHGSGSALDFFGTNETNNQLVFDWLEKNAAEYGFERINIFGQRDDPHIQLNRKPLTDSQEKRQIALIEQLVSTASLLAGLTAEPTVSLKPVGASDITEQFLAEVAKGTQIPPEAFAAERVYKLPDGTVALYTEVGVKIGDLLPVTKGAPASQEDAQELAATVKEIVNGDIRMPFVVRNPDNPTEIITIWTRTVFDLNQTLKEKGLPVLTGVITRHYAWDRHPDKNGNLNYNKLHVAAWKKLLGASEQNSSGEWIFKEDVDIAKLMRSITDAETGRGMLEADQNLLKESAVRVLVLAAALRGEANVGYILATTEAGHVTHKAGKDIDFAFGPFSLAEDYEWRQKNNPRTIGGNALATQFASFQKAQKLLDPKRTLSAGTYDTASGHITVDGAGRTWDLGNGNPFLNVLDKRIHELYRGKNAPLNNLDAILRRIRGGDDIPFEEFARIRDSSVYARVEDGGTGYVFKRGINTSSVFALTEAATEVEFAAPKTPVLPEGTRPPVFVEKINGSPIHQVTAGLIDIPDDVMTAFVEAQREYAYSTRENSLPIDTSIIARIEPMTVASGGINEELVSMRLAHTLREESLVVRTGIIAPPITEGIIPLPERIPAEVVLARSELLVEEARTGLAAARKTNASLPIEVSVLEKLYQEAIAARNFAQQSPSEENVRIALQKTRLFGNRARTLVEILANHDQDTKRLTKIMRAFDANVDSVADMLNRLSQMGIFEQSAQIPTIRQHMASVEGNAKSFIALAEKIRTGFTKTVTSLEEKLAKMEERHIALLASLKQDIESAPNEGKSVATIPILRPLQAGPAVGDLTVTIVDPSPSATDSSESFPTLSIVKGEMTDAEYKAVSNYVDAHNAILTKKTTQKSNTDSEGLFSELEITRELMKKERLEIAGIGTSMYPQGIDGESTMQIDVYRTSGNRAIVATFRGDDVIGAVGDQTLLYQVTTSPGTITEKDNTLTYSTPEGLPEPRSVIASLNEESIADGKVGIPSGSIGPEPRVLVDLPVAITSLNLAQITDHLRSEALFTRVDNAVIAWLQSPNRFARFGDGRPDHEVAINDARPNPRDARAENLRGNAVLREKAIAQRVAAWFQNQNRFRSEPEIQVFDDAARARRGLDPAEESLPPSIDPQPVIVSREPPRTPSPNPREFFRSRSLFSRLFRPLPQPERVLAINPRSPISQLAVYNARDLVNRPNFTAPAGSVLLYRGVGNRYEQGYQEREFFTPSLSGAVNRAQDAAIDGEEPQVIVAVLPEALYRDLELYEYLLEVGGIRERGLAQKAGIGYVQIPFEWLDSREITELLVPIISGISSQYEAVRTPLLRDLETQMVLNRYARAQGNEKLETESARGIFNLRDELNAVDQDFVDHVVFYDANSQPQFVARTQEEGAVPSEEILVPTDDQGISDPVDANPDRVAGGGGGPSEDEPNIRDETFSPGGSGGGSASLAYRVVLLIVGAELADQLFGEDQAKNVPLVQESENISPRQIQPIPYLQDVARKVFPKSIQYALRIPEATAPAKSVESAEPADLNDSNSSDQVTGDVEAAEALADETLDAVSKAGDAAQRANSDAAGIEEDDSLEEVQAARDRTAEAAREAQEAAREAQEKVKTIEAITDPIINDVNTSEELKKRAQEAKEKAQEQAVATQEAAVSAQESAVKAVERYEERLRIAAAEPVVTTQPEVELAEPVVESSVQPTEEQVSKKSSIKSNDQQPIVASAKDQPNVGGSKDNSSTDASNGSGDSTGGAGTGNADTGAGSGASGAGGGGGGGGGGGIFGSLANLFNALKNLSGGGTPAGEGGSEASLLPEKSQNLSEALVDEPSYVRIIIDPKEIKAGTGVVLSWATFGVRDCKILYADESEAVSEGGSARVGPLYVFTEFTLSCKTKYLSEERLDVVSASVIEDGSVSSDKPTEFKTNDRPRPYSGVRTSQSATGSGSSVSDVSTSNDVSYDSIPQPSLADPSQCPWSGNSSEFVSCFSAASGF